jgi:hypothetical protein
MFYLSLLNNAARFMQVPSTVYVLDMIPGSQPSIDKAGPRSLFPTGATAKTTSGSTATSGGPRPRQLGLSEPTERSSVQRALPQRAPPTGPRPGLQSKPSGVS